MNTYSEQIFQSIDTIISQRLNEVSFDKTEICKIVSQNKDYPERYWVTNEAGLKYEAYSVDENKKYFEGQKIYVTVPQGNYELRKLIIGTYSADEIPKSLYTNPFSQLVVVQKEELINTGLSIKNLNSNNPPNSITVEGLTFTNSGLGQYDYLGIEFSLTTGFGGTTGEFQIILEPLNKDGGSLISSDELGLFTISSKQLYGNPYYLNESLVFHHLFNFPIGSLEDLSLIKKIRVTLVSKGGFEKTGTITLNSLNLYVGYDKDTLGTLTNNLVLDLDNTDSFEYEQGATETANKKRMSIDWFISDANTIYNENNGKQYPEPNKFDVYWLQYSDAVAYTKLLETTLQNFKDLRFGEEEVLNPIENWGEFSEQLGKTFTVLSKAQLTELTESFLTDSYEDYEKTIDTILGPIFIDIPESGTYWKTVKKVDAFNEDAYTYTLHPCEDWKKEQIKVIIKNRETGEYIQSNGLTFINKTFKTETGSNQGKKETLKLSLAPGDDGIYNEYGIDNKRLTNGKNEHTIIVDYIDNTQWNNALQEVVWKIPANNSMIAIPKVKNEEGTYIPDPNWGEPKDGYYEYRNSDTIDAKRITFALSDQFGFGKVNNIISCEIIRYKYENDTTVITDTYQGTLQLQFGTQGTSGSGYAFNLYPSHPYGLSNDVSITFSTKLENNKGEDIPIDVNKLRWYFMYGSRMFPIQKPDMITNEDTKELEQKKDAEGKDVFTSQLGAVALTVTWNGGTLAASCSEYDGNLIINGEYNPKYIILVAELQNFTDISGNDISLKAYYPLAISSIPLQQVEEGESQDLWKTTGYISGPSRIVYNAQGTSPNFDNTPYRLYKIDNDNNTDNDEINDLSWSIVTCKRELDDGEIYWVDIEDTNNLPRLQIKDGKYSLSPTPYLQTNIIQCRVVAKQNSTELWSQPLLILKNTYMFDFLNSWDGNLNIDTEGNRILTQLIGAGVKNDSNQFSGVLLGAVGQMGTAATGLYGFEDGVMRYKLDEKGSFYVGTGSDNFISFNEGITGRSGSGELFIKINKFKLDADPLWINSTATGFNSVIKFSDKFELRADGTATIGGWNIKNDGLSTTSKNNYCIYLGTGENGIINGHNLTLTFQAGPYFGVTTSGELYSSAGNIAGWTIRKDEIYNNNAGISVSDLYKKDSLVSEKSQSAVRFYAGSINKTNGKFVVLDDGSLYAEAAKISGNIEATSGKIGGVLDINSGGLYYNNNLVLGVYTNQDWGYTLNSLNVDIITAGTGGTLLKINRTGFTNYEGRLIGKWYYGEEGTSLIADQTWVNNKLQTLDEQIQNKYYTKNDVDEKYNYIIDDLILPLARRVSKLEENV